MRQKILPYSTAGEFTSNIFAPPWTGEPSQSTLSISSLKLVLKIVLLKPRFSTYRASILVLPEAAALFRFVFGTPALSFNIDADSHLTGMRMQSSRILGA